MPLPPRKKYINKTDWLVLEDQAQRIHLTGDIPVDEMLTGVTVALLGYISDSGKFHVGEYCFAGECPTVDVTMSNSINNMPDDDSDKYDSSKNFIHFLHPKVASLLSLKGYLILQILMCQNNLGIFLYVLLECFTV